MKDASGQKLDYFYYEDERGRPRMSPAVPLNSHPERGYTMRSIVLLCALAILLSGCADWHRCIPRQSKAAGGASGNQLKAAELPEC